MTTYRLMIGGRAIARFDEAKFPGTHTVTDVTLRRGVILEPAFANWIRGAKTKYNATLQTLDGSGRAIASYSLAHCWVSKFQGPALGQGNDVAIETLEICPEALEIPLVPKKK